MINPEAGKKRGRKLSTQITKLWESEGICYEICMTKSQSDIAACVTQALKGDATEIIIVGGDGTLLEAVIALNGNSIPIGVIPCGTGNDFIRSHKIGTEIHEALRTVLKSENLKTVDVGNCNGSYFLNIASMGIDAAIVKRTASLKRWLKGPLVYLVASIAEIFNDHGHPVTISIDGVSHERIVEMVVIANGRFYGGGMEIAPMADPTDGFYDIIVVRKMTRPRLLKLLPTLYWGKHIGEPEVEVFKGRVIQIHSVDLMIINRDGELSEGRLLEASEIAGKIQIITNI